jgi:hypothetical protein
VERGFASGTLGNGVVETNPAREAGDSIKPRSTLGSMLSPASRAAIIYCVRDPRLRSQSLTPP